LASASEGRVSLLAAVTQDLAGRLDARLLIKELAALVGGGGGGNALMAEAGGKDPERIPAILSAAPDLVSRLLVSASPRTPS